MSAPEMGSSSDTNDPFVTLQNVLAPSKDLFWHENSKLTGYEIQRFRELPLNGVGSPFHGTFERHGSDCTDGHNGPGTRESFSHDDTVPTGSDTRLGDSGGFSSAGSAGNDYSDRKDSYPPREQLPLPTQPPYTARIGNMSFDATLGDVSDFFRDCQVTNVRIVVDKLAHKLKGIVYVEFGSLEGLKKALSYNGNQLGGRAIRISVADPPRIVEIPQKDDNTRQKVKKPRTSRQQPQRKDSFCNLCNDHPTGFHGEHELQRHIQRHHPGFRKVWICKDSPNSQIQPIIPLASCIACRTEKPYGANYNAAAHLRRAHFHPCKNKRGGRGKISEGRGRMGGGDEPPMDELKNWMFEKEEIDVSPSVEPQNISQLVVSRRRKDLINDAPPRAPDNKSASPAYSTSKSVDSAIGLSRYFEGFTGGSVDYEPLFGDISLSERASLRDFARGLHRIGSSTTAFDLVRTFYSALHRDYPSSRTQPPRHLLTRFAPSYSPLSDGDSEGCVRTRSFSDYRLRPGYLLQGADSSENSERRHSRLAVASDARTGFCEESSTPATQPNADENPITGFQVLYGQMDPDGAPKRKDEEEDKHRWQGIWKEHGSCIRCQKMKKQCNGEGICNRCRRRRNDCIRICNACWSNRNYFCDEGACCKNCRVAGITCVRPSLSHAESMPITKPPEEENPRSQGHSGLNTPQPESGRSSPQSHSLLGVAIGQEAIDASQEKALQSLGAASESEGENSFIEGWGDHQSPGALANENEILLTNICDSLSRQLKDTYISGLRIGQNDVQLGVPRYNSCAGSDSSTAISQKSKDTNTVSQTTAPTTELPLSKKRDLEDGDDDEQSRHQKRKKPRLSCAEARSLDGRLLACPYFKYDPTRYSERNVLVLEQTYRGCSSCILRDISRLKQHLYRVHRRPEHYCGRCSEEFASQDALDTHTRAEIRCDAADPRYPEKMTSDQLTCIKRKKPGRNLHDTWYNIFKILFPGAPLPTSPFAECVPTDAIASFVVHAERQGPALLSGLISTDLQNLRFYRQHDRQIVEEAMERAFPQVIRELSRGFSQFSSQSDVRSSQSALASSSALGEIGQPVAPRDAALRSTLNTTSALFEPDQSARLEPPQVYSVPRLDHQPQPDFSAYQDLSVGQAAQDWDFAPFTNTSADDEAFLIQNGSLTGQADPQSDFWGMLYPSDIDEAHDPGGNIFQSDQWPSGGLNTAQGK